LIVNVLTLFLYFLNKSKIYLNSKFLSMNLFLFS
jgi:hypothetical protein